MKWPLEILTKHSDVVNTNRSIICSSLELSKHISRQKKEESDVY